MWSIIDNEIKLFVCIAVLVVYLRLLLNLNMNEINTKTHEFTTFRYHNLWLFFNVLTPMWLRQKMMKYYCRV